MPRRKEAEPLVKVTLNLYRRDYERMHEIFATVGAAKAIRALVRQHVLKVDTARARASEPLVRELDIDLGDD